MRVEPDHAEQRKLHERMADECGDARVTLVGAEAQVQQVEKPGENREEQQRARDAMEDREQARCRQVREIQVVILWTRLRRGVHVVVPRLQAVILAAFK
jgi:hypothetical protein